MSIEALIQENTDALRALTEAIKGIIPKVAVETAVKQEEPSAVVLKVAEEVKPEPVKAVKKEKKAKPEPVKCLEPEVEEDDPLADYEADVEVAEAAMEEAKPVLPPGKRDQAFYDAHVMPVLKEFDKMDNAALVNIVRVQYGVMRANAIPSDQWDELVTKVRAGIEAHQSIV